MLIIYTSLHLHGAKNHLENTCQQIKFKASLFINNSFSETYHGIVKYKVMLPALRLTKLHIFISAEMCKNLKEKLVNVTGNIISYSPEKCVDTIGTGNAPSNYVNLPQCHQLQVDSSNTRTPYVLYVHALYSYIYL